MTRTALTAVPLFIYLLLAPVVEAQTIIQWDLATDPTRTQSMRAGENFTVVAMNRTKAEYTLSIVRSRIAIEPLNETKFQKREGAPPAEKPCEKVVEDFRDAVGKATNEQQIRDAVVSAEIDSRRFCSEVQITSVVQPLIKQLTQVTLISTSLGSGEQLVIELSRGTGAEAKSFKLTLTTGAAIEWLTTYGFNYVPRHDETFFLKPRTDSKFDIARETDTDDYDFVPTIHFSALPTKTLTPLVLRIGATVGFGFESKDPVLFIGPTLNIAQNVAINAGLVMRPEKRLNPRLDEKTPVSENLSDEQLHRSGYHPNWFFGISVNFSGNPFAPSKPAAKSGSEGTNQK